MIEDTPILPNAADCERELIAQLLASPNIATQEAIELGLVRSEFYNRDLGRIFGAAIAIVERGETVQSQPVLFDQLRADDCLQSVMNELTRLPSHYGVSDRAYLVNQIKKTAALRRARQRIGLIADQIDEGEFDAPEPVLAAVTTLEKELQPQSIDATNLFHTARQIDEDPAVEPEWILRGYLVPGAVTELVGRIKEGKTSFALALIKAALNGGYFLGQRIHKQPVVLLSEQPRLSLLAQMRQAGITRTPDSSGNLHILLHSDVRNLSFAQVIRLAVAKCKAVQAKVLVVDSFGVFAKFAGTEENNSGDGQRAMSELVWAATEGLAVFLLRHAVKGTGRDAQDAGRGSGAVSGAADIILHLKKLEGNQDASLREIAGIGRFADTPERAVIKFHRTTGEFEAMGDIAAVKHAQTRTRVIELLSTTETGLTVPEIGEDVDAGRSTIDKVLKELEAEKLARKHGSGKRGDPFRFLSVTTGAGSDRNQSAQTGEGAKKLSIAYRDVVVAERNNGSGVQKQDLPSTLGQQEGQDCFLSQPPSIEQQKEMDASQELTGSVEL